MVVFGLLLIGMEFLYNVHGLKTTNIDLNEILNYIDRYKNVQQKESNRAQIPSKRDINDIARLIQNLDYNDEKKKSYIKKYDFLYDKDDLFDNYNMNDNLHPSLMSILKKYKNLYKNKVKMVTDFNKKGSQESHDPLPAGNNEFSKVYVILDTKVDFPKTAARDIAKVISSLFSKHGSYSKPKDLDHSRKIQTYKGFTIKDNRRRIKESKEIFASKDSIERDYKPKRARADYGGGGRTAIPYIRHRGDIYERE